MSKRFARFVLLCEDRPQQQLFRAYLKRCGVRSVDRYVRALVASDAQCGGNDRWVLQQFPQELKACRQRQKRASTLLVVLIDADHRSVEQRRRELCERVKLAGLDELVPHDPVVLLIPKRHIETWIRALVGENVTEIEDCKSWRNASRDVVRRAAEILFDWSRENSVPGPTCLPSLRQALPEWKKIG